MKQRIGIRLLGSDDRILDQAIQDIVDVAKYTDAKVGGPILIPFSINASEKIKNRIYQRMIYIINPSERTLNELKKLNLPSSIEVRISSEN